MTGIARRVYGGMGIAVEEPRIEVSVRKSDANTLVGPCRVEHRLAIKELAVRMGVPPTRIEVYRCPPAHHGYGATTALLMSVAASISMLWDLSYSEEQLIVASGRGGTSGVGCRTFFHGGIVVDAGHLRNEFDAFAPSAARKPAQLPVMNLRIDFPQTWRVALVEPSGVTVNGAREIEFFRSNAPIPRAESLEAIALAYHGIIPAFYAKDMSQLKLALLDVHHVGFKKRELDNQSPDVRACLRDLAANESIAAGMSSFGPLLYAIYEDQNHPVVFATLERVKTDYRAKVTYTRASNRGVTLTHHAE